MATATKKIHFNAMPTSMRRRLVECLAGREEPRPISSHPESTTGSAFGWAFFALLGLAGLYAAWTYEFGRAYFPRQGVEYMAAYVLAFFVLVHGAIASIRAIVRGRSLPFVPGRYVFPLDIVIAKGSEVEWIPTSSIGAVNAVHHHRNGVYGGTSFDVTLPDGRKENFWLNGKEEPQRILRAIDASIQRVRDAATRADMATVRSLDLFFDVRGAPQLEDPAALAIFRERHEREAETPLARDLPGILARSALIALAVAILLGPPTWWIRNRLSDEDIFARLPSSSRYEVDAYLRSSGSHVAEARSVILPAVVFRETMNQRSATSLRAFLAEFPSAPQVPAARASLRALYDDAYRAFATGAPNDARLLALMRGMLTHLESSISPTVLVRFFPPSSEALSEADADLARRGRREAGHDVSPIAPYFGSDGTVTLESSVTSRLDAGFSRIFAADVFHLTHGGRIVGAEGDASVAALDVRYVVRPSGSLYINERDQRAFVGIHVDFRVLMRAPGTTETYEFSLEVEPPQTFSVSYNNGNQASDSSIYATMTERAFDRLADGLSAAFFANAAPATGATGK